MLSRLLLYYFSLLPAKIFASTLSAFNGRGGISGAAFSADFNIKPSLLG